MSYFLLLAVNGLVIGSVIFFGNDETAIEKCVAVRKGEAESMAKNSKLPSGEFLASGYMRQLAENRY